MKRVRKTTSDPIEQRILKLGARVKRLEEDLRGTIEQVQFLTKRAVGVSDEATTEQQEANDAEVRKIEEE